MKTAKTTIFSLAVLSLALFLPATARADWSPEDPYKYLQLPDLTTNGMDVNASGHDEWLEVPGGGEAEFFIPKILADDFECTQTEYITDIHIWGSWKGDILPQVPDVGSAPIPDPGNVLFGLAIFDDIPEVKNTAGEVLAHSRPGAFRWGGFFFPGDFAVAPPLQVLGGGKEGWFDPNTGVYTENADENIYQYNFDIPVNPGADSMVQPAFQQQGTAGAPITYWLAVLAIPDPYDLADPPPPEGEEPMFGWKTRDPNEGHYMDDAVWTDLEPILDGTEGDVQGPQGEWYTIGPWGELRYPNGHPYGPDTTPGGDLGLSIDLAFVITPEPATLIVLALGLIPTLLRRRKRA